MPYRTPSQAPGSIRVRRCGPWAQGESAVSVSRVALCLSGPSQLQFSSPFLHELHESGMDKSERFEHE